MKKLRDPIYGYISIEDSVIQDIIDTATFQRLRFIIQTSYSPLYASAVHNRFVHSLGVYHLGEIVASEIKVSTANIRIDSKIDYIKFFKYACLLHDVGHAPFSHTGEDFYLSSGVSRNLLHEEIVSLTNDQDLKQEIETRNYSAAPHELMSVIVALKSFPNLFADDVERSFFARCILGYDYVNELNLEKSLFNCMISMLNSSVIDVDKLDYLIRDAYITGFDTVSLDYTRLLKSVKIINIDDRCSLVFKKTAISVIENVVFAHDAERKWIQNHPIVQYDIYLLKHAMEVLNTKYNLFTYDSLTLQGKNISPDFNISLLCDGDVLFLMKNITNDPLILEYFSRKDRKHPLWKSEAEYKAIFGIGFTDQIFNTVEDEFDELAKYLNFVTKSSEINSFSLKALNVDIEKTKKLMEDHAEFETKLNTQLRKKNKHLKWILCLKDFAKNQNIEFDFLIIKASQFNSGFGKLAFGNIQIEFPALKSPCNFKKVTNSLSASKSERDKFYYLFFNRTSKATNIEVVQLASMLGTLALEEVY